MTRREIAYLSVFIILLSLLAGMIYLLYIFGKPVGSETGKGSLSREGYEHIASTYGNSHDRISKPTEAVADENGN